MNKTLKNGAKVIQESTRPDDASPGVVFAKWGSEYVTWLISHGDNTSLGHYFPRFREAALDYIKRCDDLEVVP